MFTAEEYRTAIKVLREHSCSDLADDFVYFEQQAKKAETWENYARSLGALFQLYDSEQMFGDRVLRKIIDDGWTPPEGLF